MTLSGRRLSRRAVLAGGIGAGVLLALPVTAAEAKPGAGSAASGDPWYAFLYGTPDSSPYPGGSVAAAKSPGAISSAVSTPFQLASQLAATPVVSPDQTTVALVTVSGATVTLNLVGKATAATTKQGTLTLTGVPADASILATTIFAPGTTTVALVLAISVPSSGGMLTKKDQVNGGVVTATATTWRSSHVLAYFDSSTGAFTGPFDLADEPALALTTAAANGTDLFLWTTPEPRAAAYSKSTPTAAPLSTVRAYPLGSGQSRFAAPSLAPWPGGEPVVTLASGDVARLVYGRDLQVCSAQTGNITTRTLASIAQWRPKISAVTMQARSDGTLFITKPGLGTAIVVDPANSFAVTSAVSFPVPLAPGSAPWSKAVLSPAGDTLYVLGGSSSGGVSAYDMSSGSLTASYVTGGVHYGGLSVQPNGNVLAVGPAHPRLTYFDPELSLLGTADTNLQISAVF
jgi:hypothetical protein